MIDCRSQALYPNDVVESTYALPRGELHPCIEGKRPENKVKNRYTTIFPCMHFNRLK